MISKENLHMIWNFEEFDTDFLEYTNKHNLENKISLNLFSLSLKLYIHIHK